MTSSDLSAKVAFPGAADLDADVTDVRLTAVIRNGNDFIVDAVGGRGIVVADEPGRPVKEFPLFPSIQLTFCLQMEEGWRHVLDDLVDRLDSWQQDQTPLRLCMAQGKWTSLSAPDGSWRAFPG